MIKYRPWLDTRPVTRQAPCLCLGTTVVGLGVYKSSSSGISEDVLGTRGPALAGVTSDTACPDVKPVRSMML